MAARHCETVWLNELPRVDAVLGERAAESVQQRITSICLSAVHAALDYSCVVGHFGMHSL